MSKVFPQGDGSLAKYQTFAVMFFTAFLLQSKCENFQGIVTV
jgi:hypothetical protein